MSIASLWEIAIKQGLEKLKISGTITDIAKMCSRKDIEILRIKPKHLDKLKNLPDIHKDPFDRLLIAQAITENRIIITKDSKIMQYDCVKVLW